MFDAGYLVHLIVVRSRACKTSNRDNEIHSSIGSNFKSQVNRTQCHNDIEPDWCKYRCCYYLNHTGQ